MTLPRFAMQRRPIALTLIALTLVLGVFQYQTMSRRADPAFTIRTAQVITSWPGVEAERVERLVTSPLEAEISQLEEVDYVWSTTTTGHSVIYVELPDALPTDLIQATWERVRGKVDLVRPRLPAGAGDPKVNDDFGDTSIMLLAIHEPIAPGAVARYEPRELTIIAKRIRERLSLLDGVAKATLHGDPDEAIYVECDPAVWAAADLTLDRLGALLEARNIRSAGGSVDTDEVRVGVQPTGEFGSVSEIMSVVVDHSEVGTPVTLGDLGFNVRRDYADPPSVLVRYGDRAGSAPSIVCSIIMQDGYKVTDLGPEIIDTVRSMQAIDRTIPDDIAVDVVFDEAQFVDKKISDFVVNVLQAVLIVVAVALLMAGFRSAIVMAAAIPFVMIISIGLSAVAGVDLEQMSIASLIIALGMLVDNAVVVCDNTKRFMDEGLPRAQAAVTGVEQIMYPTLMGTLTTVCAFAPLAFFLTGARQEYVLSIPLVVCITLLSSWVLAMTLTTLMAYAVIRPSSGGAGTPLGWVAQRIRRLRGQPDREGNAFLDGYAALLRGLLKVKTLVLLCAAALLVGSTALPVGNEFFPDDLRDFAYVDVWLPEGSSLKRTDEVTRRVEGILRELSPGINEKGEPIERLARFYSSVGGSGPRFSPGVSPTPPSANFAQIIIQTTDPLVTAGYLADIHEAGNTSIPGARIIPRRLALGPPVDSPIGIRIFARGFEDPGFGDEWTLRRVADRVRNVLHDVEGLWDVHDAWQGRGYQLDVNVDESRAKLAGVTNASIAETLNAYYTGHLLTKFRDGADQIPVLFRLPPEQRSIDTPPQSVFVEGSSGKVAVDAVADTEFRRALTRVERREQNRMLEVRAKVETGYLANDRLAVARPALDEIEADLPAGVWFEYGGTLEKTAESQGEMIMAFGIGVLLIVLCLVIQYNSVIKPIIVLTTVPMGLIGALFGLWITGNALGFMPLLGLVSLAGIVVNSAILYIEFADGLIAERRAAQPAGAEGERLVAGLPRAEFRRCLADAGKMRLPAILLTVTTTVGGLIPLALFGGPMWEGMAYLLIFGLIVATVMTLLLLPVIYAFFAEVLRFDPVPAKEELESST